MLELLIKFRQITRSIFPFLGWIFRRLLGCVTIAFIAAILGTLVLIIQIANCTGHQDDLERMVNGGVTFSESEQRRLQKQDQDDQDDYEKMRQEIERDMAYEVAHAYAYPQPASIKERLKSESDQFIAAYGKERFRKMEDGWKKRHPTTQAAIQR